MQSAKMMRIQDGIIISTPQVDSVFAFGRRPHGSEIDASIPHMSPYLVLAVGYGPGL